MNVNSHQQNRGDLKVVLLIHPVRQAQHIFLLRVYCTPLEIQVSFGGRSRPHKESVVLARSHFPNEQVERSL